MAKFTTSIWHESANHKDSFNRDSASCMGYDITTELLPKAEYINYLFLLISGRRPSETQSTILEKLAILLANFGVRDISIRAAMNAGVGKAPSASVLIAALSGNSGRKGGCMEISESMKILSEIKSSKSFSMMKSEPIWPQPESPPGFTNDIQETEAFTLNCLSFFAQFKQNKYCIWLKDHLEEIESLVKSKLSLMGVTSAILLDLELTEEQSEYLYLILRLPGAAAHSMEQKELGWKSFPFFADTVTYDGLNNLNDNPDLPDVSEILEEFIDE